MSAKDDTVSGKRLSSLFSAWKILENDGWLSKCSDSTREMLFGIARIQDVGAGRFIYVTGDTPNGVFGLVRGALDISIPRADGQSLMVHRADPGFWIGDLAVFSNQVRLVSVCTAVPSRLVRLPQEKLGSLVESNPELTMDFYRLSHSNVSLALQLLGNLSITPSEIRVALRLLQHEEMLPAREEWIRLSQETLSQLVALSLPTLQRALRKLEEGGFVEVGYGRVRIRDRAGLLRLCGDVALEAATP